MSLIGVLLISGLFNKLIGLFIVIYSVTEIDNYIYFRTKNKSYTASKKSSPKNKKKKRLKEGKVVDAIIEE